jgi:plastocyanin
MDNNHPLNRHRMLGRLLAAVTALIMIAAGCGGDGYTSAPGGSPGGSSGTTSNSITVRNNVFDPSATTVAVGTTVTWTWAQGSTDHNVTFDDGAKSATQATGGYSRVFGAAGAFPYRCTIHPGMNGTVTVR